MRKILSLVCLIILLGSTAKAQCQSDECVAKVSGGFIFLKSYQMDKLGPQTEYSYVFSKDMNYMLVLCGATSENVIVTLYDAGRKEIATNFDKTTGKYYHSLVYQCKATGIYYMKFTYKVKSECCTSVLAFKK